MFPSLPKYRLCTVKDGKIKHEEKINNINNHNYHHHHQTHMFWIYFNCLNKDKQNPLLVCAYSIHQKEAILNKILIYVTVIRGHTQLTMNYTFSNAHTSISHPITTTTCTKVIGFHISCANRGYYPDFLTGIYYQVGLECSISEELSLPTIIMTKLIKLNKLRVKNIFYFFKYILSICENNIIECHSKLAWAWDVKILQ